MNPVSELTIPGIAAQAAAQFGAQTAVVDGDRQFSFAALWLHAQKAASAFIAAGMVKGDRIAIWAPNSVDWIIACIGAQAAGGIVVTLNTRLKGDEAGYILRKSGARILITVKDFLGVDYPNLLIGQTLPNLRQILCFGEQWDHFLNDMHDNIQLPDILPSDPCDILFTSGTTGNPKGVVSTHGQSVQTFQIWADRVGLITGDRYLIINPFFHSFGYKAGWLACLIKGAVIYPVATLDTGQLASMIAAHNITVLPGPPAIFQSLLNSDFSGQDISSLRLAVTGAASVPPELIEQMRDILNIDHVLIGYGLTESCGVVSLSAPDDSADVLARTCGTPIPGIEVRIANPDENGAGEIQIRGFNVMQGYFEDAEATAKAITPDGWLMSGDIGRFTPEGQIVITDRIKDMYISGGFNCYPAEIERILLQHPGITQAAVIGIPDPRMGEIGKAFIVLRPGHDLDPQSILDWSRSHMANYKAPRSVEIRDALPLNASGKVQKFALR